MAFSGPLGFPFKTLDPFLFCVYHNDAYPAGSETDMFAPARGNGADFDWTKRYRMYHGDRIPGFPRHPHRGFETLTLVQEGTCDHSDSLGAAGRYGGDGRRGDLQWMTAGTRALALFVETWLCLVRTCCNCVCCILQRAC